MPAAPALEHILQVFHAFAPADAERQFSPKPPSKAVLARAMCAAPLTPVTPYYAPLEFDAEPNLSRVGGV